MKINGKTITQTRFAFDGCHKIYLLDDEDQAIEALESGYEIRPIHLLPDDWESSCNLRFISDWALTNGYVGQCEAAIFEEFES